MIEDQADLPRIGYTYFSFFLARITQAKLEIDRKDGGGHFRIESLVLERGAKCAVNLGACVSKPFKIGEGAVGKSAKACDVRYPARVFAFSVRALGLAERKVFVKQFDDVTVVCRFLERGTAWFVLRSLVVCGHSDLAFPSVPQSFYRQKESHPETDSLPESQQYHEF